ncbi:MAG: hypothetical protein ABR528_01555 [Pseudonocardiaceae bacterium]
MKPEPPPTDSATAQSSRAKGEPGDLFTPRNPHTTPSSNHQSAIPPPSGTRDALQAVLAETPANQSAPPPRRWPFPLPPSLVTAGCAALAIIGVAVSVLLVTAHHNSTAAPTPPLVTQISGPAASTAAPPSTTMVPRVPADAAAPSRAPAKATDPAVTLAAPAPDGAPQAVDPQPSHQISQPSTAASPAAPPAPPALQDSPPLPPSSAGQQSPWHWDKTTTCDPSGHCIDHYNPKPTTPGDGSTSPPASNTTGSTQPPASWQHAPWAAPHDTTPTGP